MEIISFVAFMSHFLSLIPFHTLLVKVYARARKTFARVHVGCLVVKTRRPRTWASLRYTVRFLEMVIKVIWERGDRRRASLMFSL